MMTAHRDTETPRKSADFAAQYLGASVCRGTRSYWLFIFAALSASVLFVTFAVDIAAQQQILDRVVARIGSTALTQTDVEAAVEFGIVDPKAGDPLKQMIDRKLMLAEVNRFPPPDPDMRVVQDLMVRMKAAAGADVNSVMRRTGVDDKRLSELARETLRLQSYIQQRFGNSTRSEQQLERWITDLRARGDVSVIPQQ